MGLKKNTFFAIITVLAIVALLYVLQATLFAPSCDFIIGKDLPAKLKSQTGRSENNLALVSVSSHLQYPDKSDPSKNGTEDDQKNVLLDFDRFDFEQLDQNRSKEILHLDSYCSNIKLNIVKIDNGFEVESIHVSIRVPNYDTQSCKVNKVDPPIKQINGSHFKGKDLAFFCKDSNKDSEGGEKSRDVVYLVFDSLEFEIYGDLKKTENLEFTTPAAN